MRYLMLGELLELHVRIIEQSGGAAGIRDLGLAESALAQPQMSFGGTELYASLADKAAALCFSLVMNHPFVDGNKRTAAVVSETFILLNGAELLANDAELVVAFVALAAGDLSEEELADWFREHLG